MRIRKAEKKDIEIICAMYKELFAESACQEPFHYKSTDQSIAFIEKVIEGVESDVLLAERDGGKVIGFALIKANYTIDMPCIVSHHYAYLMDLSVSKSEQGKGAGTLLIKACKHWAQTHKLDYLELNVLEQNKDATKLYKQNEFKPIIHTLQYRF